MGVAHDAVKRELLVRLLDSAAPALVHRGFTYAEGYAAAESAIAALRVFGEFADRLRRPVAVVLVGGNDALRKKIERVRGELGLPSSVSVVVVAGRCDTDLVPALERVEAFGAPILAYLDAAGATPPASDTVAGVCTGHHADALIAVDPTDRPYGQELRRAGLTRVTAVELVDEGGYAQLLFFATGTDKHLDRFKDELWSVDEFAGVRYRDPGDPDRELLDISLDPHLGPLRRMLVDRVETTGACPAGELRDYTRTETIYRAEDALRALGGLVSTGKLRREPERGRLTAKTLIYPCDLGHLDRL